ncbi:MAG: ATP-dependent helicase [Nitrosopumilus sp.]|nr:ATP-dependent helicase [Nitrosopumilus sp.]
MKPNYAQATAIEHTGSPLLVTAGPGSGKTRVITERIKFLLKTGLKPSEILCLTFSEKAANDLQTRLEEDEAIKEKIDISEMTISTYHSFCRNLLKDNTLSTGLGMKGGILDRPLFLVWGVQNIDKFGFDDHIEIGNNAADLIEKMIDGISVFNDELIPPEELEKYVQGKLKNPETMKDVEEVEYMHLLDNLVKIYKAYIDFKKEKDIMDFDDLIVHANKLLENKEKPHALKAAQEKYKHILIDEFQDNNYAQFSVVKNLANNGNVTAVGDADQNIYRFQGAYTQIFDDFKKSFPDYTEVQLTENWRNPQKVINLSNQLLQQDQFREQKTIIPTKDDDQKVNVVECSSEFAQAEFIKNKISELKKENSDYKFSDFAILSRKQKDGLNVAQILASEGMPVKYVGKSEISNSPNAKLLFSYLRIIANPMKSMTSIMRILQEFGISEQNISKINHEATIRARTQTDGDYAFDVLSDLKLDGLTQKTELQEISSLINEFIGIAKNQKPSQTIYQIIRNKTDIYQKIANDDSIQNFIERSILNDILNSAYDYEKINHGAEIKDFLEFADELDKFDIETKRDTAESNSIQVSTIHKSKGLEFKTVFIIDVATFKIPLRYTEKPFYVPQELSKGVMPVSNPKEEFLREERRILYVGMTRTIDNLYIMYPTQYENRIKANKPSKFLQPLKPETNDNVDFIKYDSNSSSNISTTFDAVEIIKNEQLNNVIKYLHSGQYSGAIQKILDLGQIEFFQKNNTTKGFSPEKLLEQAPSDDMELKLLGTKPEALGFQKKNLSFSKFDTYEKCPKQFWYQHVLNALPENQETSALYKGSTFHSIVEDSGKRQKEGVIDDAKVLLDELEALWDPNQYLTTPVQKEHQDRQSLEPALQSYQKWSSSNPNKIVALELPFTVHIGGFQVNGVIDRVEETPQGEYVVIDYKTGGKNKKVDATNSVQLNLYSLALKENHEFGKYPVSAIFFYVEKPEGEQLFEYKVDGEKVNEIKTILEGYVKSIKDKAFKATPEMFTCKWCQYSDICNDAI